MKKLFLSLTLFLFAAALFAQQPLAFNYQGIARNAAGQAYKDKTLNINIAITSAASATPAYSETFTGVSTSNLGVFNLRIGTGKVTSNTALGSINWRNGPYSLAVSIQPTAADPFFALPASPILFVPTALYAEQAADADHAVNADVAQAANTVPSLNGVNGIGVSGTTIGINVGGVINDKLGGDAVTSAKIMDGEVKSGDIGDGEVRTEEIFNGTIKSEDLSSMGAANDQVMKWNGGAWVAGNDNEGTPSNLQTGGDLSGTLNNAQIVLGAVRTEEILNGTIMSEDLSQMGAGVGSVMKWDGSKWAAADDNDSGVTAGNGISISGNQISIKSVIDMPSGLTISGGPLVLTSKKIKTLPVTSENAPPALPVIKFLSEYGTEFSGHDHGWGAFADRTTSASTLGKIHVAPFPLPPATLSTLDIPVDFSLESAGSIIAPSFFATSDKRIKSNVNSINNYQTRQNYNQLRVVSYLFRDRFTKGDSPQVGFIAQEVEKVFPEAVSCTTDFIPNVYQVARQVVSDPQQHTLSLTVDSLSDIAIGDKVRIIADQTHEVIVSAVSGTTLTVRDWPEANTRQAFVYGKQVNDFRVVDYDRIFTLNVSATQALIQEVEELKKQVADLQTQNLQLSSQNTATQQRFASLEQRLEALAARVGGVSEGEGKEKK